VLIFTKEEVSEEQD